MSHTIVYDRQFLRLPNGIVPLILSGSNNCTEPMPNGRERRERGWCIFFDTPVITEKELMERTESCCGGLYQEHFKRGGKWVDDAGFRRFMQQGIKTARSLEEILAACPAQSFCCALHIWPKKYSDGMKTELQQYVHTTQEVSDWIVSARKRAAQCEEQESVFYHMAFSIREPLRLPRIRIHNEPVIVRYEKSYIVSINNSKLTLTCDPDSARVFVNMESAKNELPPRWLSNIRFIKAETAQGRYCLRIENAGYVDKYVLKLSRSRLHMTSQAATAHRFLTHDAAQQYATKLAQRIRYVRMTFSVYEIPAD